MEEKLAGVGELAEILGTQKSWIYSRTRETGKNSIPRLMVGKYVKFRVSEVMEWLERKNKKN